MRKFLRFGLTFVALLVGLYHFSAGIKAVFVFRNNEPISLWVFTLAGPMSTLPAAITTFFSPRVGATWLVAGAVVSYVAALIAGGPKSNLSAAFWFLMTYSGPMFVLGLAFLSLEKRSNQKVWK